MSATCSAMNEDVLAEKLIDAMPRVARYLASTTRYGLEECEDLTAQGVERTLVINREKPGAISDGPDFFGWLLYQARSNASNYRRYRGQWARRTSSIDARFNLAASEDVEATVLTRSQLEPILALSRTDRNTWCLVMNGCGFGPVEMERALGVPNQTISYRSAAARKKLRPGRTG